MSVGEHRAEEMNDELVIQRLHDRVDSVLNKVEKSNQTITERLSDLHADVKVIKETSELREEACKKHNDKTEMLDVSIRGNGKKGVLTRLNEVEKRSNTKDKIAYIVIGALTSGVFALVIALITKITT